MTVFTDTWNATFLSQPADSEDAYLGANRIRGIKLATSERLAVDHSMAGDTLDGTHLKLTIPEIAADPTNTVDTGFVYTKNVAGATELFYEDAAGNIKQLTAVGKLNIANDSFAAGTRMLFNQTAAPTGWTKDTTAALNDTAIRIVTGAVSSGGSVAFSTVFAHAATDAHTLTIAEMPAHTHTMQPQYQVFNGGNIYNMPYGSITGGATGSTGGDGSHTHNMDIRVKYNDFIIATKD
jgi:hypothetical protein